MQPLWKSVWSIIKKLPQDPATPLLGLYLKGPSQHATETPAHACYCSTIHRSQIIESAEVSSAKEQVKMCVIGSRASADKGAGHCHAKPVLGSQGGSGHHQECQALEPLLRLLLTLLATLRGVEHRNAPSDCERDGYVQGTIRAAEDRVMYTCLERCRSSPQTHCPTTRSP